MFGLQRGLKFKLQKIKIYKFKIEVTMGQWLDQNLYVSPITLDI